MHLLLPLTKGQLSNVATISWQIVGPYYRGTTVPYLGSFFTDLSFSFCAFWTWRSKRFPRVPHARHFQLWRLRL